MRKFKKVVLCFCMLTILWGIWENMNMQACFAMSFEGGKRIFLSTWRLNYPNDEANQWYETITDNNFLGLGRYTIDEIAMPDQFSYRVTLHLNDNPKAVYWVKIREGSHGHGMKVYKVDNAWHHVLDGWRSINP